MLFMCKNKRGVLSLDWHKWFSRKRFGMKYLLLWARQNLKYENFTLSFWQTHYTKVRAARAARLFFIIQAIISLICDALVAFAIVVS